MVFRLQLPIEVECPEGELNVTVPARIDVVYRSGRWIARCQQPPVTTVMCETLDQALVAVAHEIARDATVQTAAR